MRSYGGAVEYKNHAAAGETAHVETLRHSLRSLKGGGEQIGARIAWNEIDVLLFFRDPNLSVPEKDAADMTLLRLCDKHNVPVATNIATAEALILALERGDLDWREIGNPDL